MLVTTKLQVPPLNARMVRRTHLLDRLSSGKDRRLTVIHGVAGSGKTSLACQWIEKEKLRAAWYSLDETDNESDIFFRYLLTALSDMDSRLASTAGPWLQRQKTLSGQEIVPSLIEGLTGLTEDIYLVLDDYHHITSQRIHDSLSYLLDRMPARMHLVIISRYGSPFSLSRFRVRNQITEISAEEMKFTEEETEQYFAEIMSVHLSSGEAHELARYAEGWVAWLQLLDLSLKGKETFEGLDAILNRTFYETADYLIDEVINAQPAKVKDFLYATAPLERFNAALCRELTGQPDVEDVLDYLYRNNLFLVPLNAEHTWYHYHRLFSDALKRRVKRSSPDAVPRILREAALWFARNNHLEDAFRHAFASEDSEFAADILEDYLYLVYEGYEIASGLRWLARLPHKVFMQRALLRLYGCGFKIDSGHLLDIGITVADITAHQDQFFERYEGFKKKFCQDLLTYFQQAVPFLRNLDTADPNRICEAIRAFSPENKFYYGFIKTMVTYRWQHSAQEDLLATFDAFKEILAMISSSESVWAKMTWFRSMIYMERWQGHLRKTEAILQEAFQFLDRKGLSETHFKFVFYLPMAWVFYFRNDLEKALEYGNIALRYAEQVPDIIDIVEGGILLAYTHRAMGEWEEVDKHMQMVQSLAKTADRPEMTGFTNAIQAHLSIGMGHLGWTERWAERRRLGVNEPFSLRFVFECLAQAELFYHRKRYEETVNLLEVLRTRCTERNLMEPVIDLDLILSAALYALGESERARTVMEDLLAFSEAEGYVQPIAGYGIISPVLRDMAGTLPMRPKSSHFVVIMRACGIDPDSAVGPSQPKGQTYNDLTPREIEILKMMAAGYRNKEIAEKAFISLVTVKTHIAHIFEKLDVKTRVQAIRWAEEQKLV